MRSLILKDIYNIRHHAKSMLFTLVMLGAILIFTSGAPEYIVASTVLCSMMMGTTFAFDEYSKWAQYALIMPLSRKDLVAAKYVVMGIFCGVGSLLGLLISLAAGVVLKKVHIDLMWIGTLCTSALAAVTFSMISGSISISLMFKFGTEKARLLLAVSILVPLAVYFGIDRLIVLLKVQLVGHLAGVLLCSSPIFALSWCYLMYRISCRIFEKQEL